MHIRIYMLFKKLFLNVFSSTSVWFLSLFLPLKISANRQIYQLQESHVRSPQLHSNST